MWAFLLVVYLVVYSGCINIIQGYWTLNLYQISTKMSFHPTVLRTSRQV